MGELIRNAKGREHVFSWGEILDFRTAISEESEMSAFLCFECTVLAKEDLTVKLADRTIFLSQIYPIYEEEIDFIQSIGVERFFYDLNIDFFDVKRDRVISAA
ncbi:hypothetical protein ASE26_29435 [Duganella sp. Root198D2]|nr:hypothetical protein ASD07_29555 [Duganella sp. Root336D2]KRB87472.1 hypothetical protein ASE26_29435 [Duganella sp. Root198D2]